MGRLIKRKRRSLWALALATIYASGPLLAWDFRVALAVILPAALMLLAVDRGPDVAVVVRGPR
jgi:hypothetical protein